MSLEFQPSQFSCSICGKRIEGYKFLPNARSKYALKKYIKGYQCASCEKFFCVDCQQNQVRTSWWSGWRKTKCPQCENIFGPGTVVYGEINETTVRELSASQKKFLEGTYEIKRGCFDYAFTGIFILCGIFLIFNNDILFGLLYLLLGSIGFNGQLPDGNRQHSLSTIGSTGIIFKARRL